MIHPFYPAENAMRVAAEERRTRVRLNRSWPSTALRSVGRLVPLAAASLSFAAPARPAAAIEGVPRYDHVLVIVEENKDYDRILDPHAAPVIAGLAAKYGNATRFYGETHPSEANYLALLGGDTFGIHDDDAFYCGGGSKHPFCDHAGEPGYADHTVEARHIGDQLVASGRDWRGYYGSLPAPGSLAVVAGDPAYPAAPADAPLYASKHSGFVNFAAVQRDPRRAERLVGIDRLGRDLDAGDLPAFALIVPNQCDEMHGVHAPGIPADCDGSDPAALIRRGDATVGALVRRIQESTMWKGAGNVAIVVTFDEGANRTREGCCGAVAAPGSDLGGGHIPTVVVTNHGPRGVADGTPYNHYSLLRTIEDALGITEHLRHAAGDAEGVVPMTRLFAVAGGRDPAIEPALPRAAPPIR